MSECKLSPFGLSVKIKLLEIGQTQEWLMSEIRRKTGLYMDGRYLYRILTGQRSPDKIVDAIKETLGMDGGD